MLVRDTRACAWAVHADVPSHVASEVTALARQETATRVVSAAPLHADAYVALLGGRVDSGPVFTFPPTVPAPSDTVLVTELSELTRRFRGWTADEIPERSPIVGLRQDGHIVSVCFCARLSKVAAEAGVETAMDYRGRGFGARVTAAWAQLILESGRLPLYSTSWTNAASLSVARKLGLMLCASDWSITLRSETVPQHDP